MFLRTLQNYVKGFSKARNNFANYQSEIQAIVSL